MDGIDASEIKTTKAEMVNTVNKYVSMKKEYSTRNMAREELMGGTSKAPQREEGVVLSLSRYNCILSIDRPGFLDRFVSITQTSWEQQKYPIYSGTRVIEMHFSRRARYFRLTSVQVVAESEL